MTEPTQDEINAQRKAFYEQSFADAWEIFPEGTPMPEETQQAIQKMVKNEATFDQVHKDFESTYPAFLEGLTFVLNNTDLSKEESMERAMQIIKDSLQASEQMYKGFKVLIYLIDGKWRFVLNGDYVDGFDSQEEAFDDACNRIDAIVDSL